MFGEFVQPKRRGSGNGWMKIRIIRHLVSKGAGGQTTNEQEEGEDSSF